MVAQAVVGCSEDAPPSRLDSAEPPDPPDARCAVRYFTPSEAHILDAVCARILPGDANDPGAREAGVVGYIDCLMAVGGFAEPVYLQPPFVAPDDDPQEIELPDGISWSEVGPLIVAGDPGSEQLPEGAEQAIGEEGLTELRDDSIESTSFGVIPIPKGQFDRYGYQSLAAPPELYRRGLRALDDYCSRTHGASFVDLSEDVQDEVVTALEDDSADGFSLPSAQGFFEMVRRHTIEGMFADPIYGGNRDFAGWRLIGYPGAYRAWTAVELRTEGARRPPQGITQLARTHPGEEGDEGGPPAVANPDLHTHAGGG